MLSPASILEILLGKSALTAITTTLVIIGSVLLVELKSTLFHCLLSVYYSVRSFISQLAQYLACSRTLLWKRT
jgi:hypothetical protein